MQVLLSNRLELSQIQKKDVTSASSQIKKADPLKPQQLVSIIEQLILWYQVRRSSSLALSITDHLEQLVAHPDKQDMERSTHCHYERLARKWRLLSSL